uniref:Capsid protein n=1 Tax=Dependoparvovirus sp. TaxID=2052559 RepID=A0A6M9Z7M2_9VIRU|nr:MAG: capsid protein [Dependoparvovirus sp.]
MSFVDHPPDWLETVISDIANWFHPDPGNPQPEKEEPAKKDDARGLVLPGYKYLGPGNGLDKGEPVNAADAAAREHDKGYDELLKQGENAYLTYNHADAKLQQDLQGDQTFGGNLANSVFQAKKRLLEPFGLVEKEPELAPPKRPRPQEQPSPDSSSGRGKKGQQPARKRLSFGEGTSEEGGSDPQPLPQPPSGGGEAGGGGQGPSLVPGTMSGGGGAPLGDNQQGADGVGTASGDWHCDSKWLGNTVLTRSTRTWVLPSYNNHLYRQISNGGTSGQPGNRYFGYSTPWGYFDFNRFHCHFSPRDWQRLVNNHWGFRPKSLHVKVFNIQVKEVTTQDGNTTVTNNLTSTVQIFSDEEYQLPYVCGNATEGCLPAFPPQVFTIPQYGYATLNDTANGNPTERSSFFCLEYFPSKMLRTGNNFEFSFQFEEVPFHTGFAPSQNLMKLSNPLIDQYLYGYDNTDAGGTPQFLKLAAGLYFSQYKNWHVGAHKRTQAYNMTQDTANRVNVTEVNVGNIMNVSGQSYLSRPSIPTMTNKLDGNASYALDATMLFPAQPLPPGPGSAVDSSNIIFTNESETQPVNGYAANSSGRVASNTQSSGTAPTVEFLNEAGTYPAAVWMDRDVYLHGPIWAKIPNTGAHFHPSPMMGGFGLKHPPPMMLIKNTPVPGNITTFSDVPVNQFITQYSTGQVTVSIEWELEKENSKRWNPEIQYTNNYNNPTFVDFAPNAAGDYQTTRTIGTRWLTRPL